MQYTKLWNNTFHQTMIVLLHCSKILGESEGGGEMESINPKEMDIA